jgi:hypothetical protein
MGVREDVGGLAHVMQCQQEGVPQSQLTAPTEQGRDAPGGERR